MLCWAFNLQKFGNFSTGYQGSSLYVIESNVFIQAANSYYAFDIAPKFWTWLESQLGETICTVTPVKTEILKQYDQLSTWFRSCDDIAWVLGVDDNGTQSHMPSISQHCFDNGYKESGIKKFLGCADPWVIAKALSINSTVVTHELSQPEAKKRVKIPDVCNHFGVEPITVFDLIRRLGFQL